MKLPPIHPLRFVAICFLAGTIGFGSYQMWKPNTFVYIKLKEGITVEGGTQLTSTMIEPATLIMGGFTNPQVVPIQGLFEWSQRDEVIGAVVSRRIAGGDPLLVNDVREEDKIQQEDKQMDSVITGMSIAVDNIIGVTPHLTVGDKVHIYASFEDDQGAHSGLLLRSMPVISLQREQEGESMKLVGVTISLRIEQAVYLTHALHYGKVRLGTASLTDSHQPGIGDQAFANSLLKTKKRWVSLEEEE